MKKTLLGTVAFFMACILTPMVGLAQSEQQGIAILKQAEDLKLKARSREDMQNVLAKYEEALKIFEGVESDKRKGFTLNKIGSVYKSWGQRQKALEYYEKALAINQKLGDAKAEGATLDNIGWVYQSWGKHQNAIEYFEKELAINQKLGDVKDEGETLNHIGWVYSSWYQYAKALEYFEKALAINQKLGDVKGEEANLNNIGSVYKSWDQYQKALEYYEKALAIKQKTGDVKGEGVILSNIGSVYQSWGQYQKALEYYEKALAINQKLGYVKGEGANLNNIGWVYQSWGQYQKALEYYEKALAIEKKTGDVKGEGITLTHIGMVYQSWGQYQKALEYYEKALAINQKIGDVQGEGANLNNIAGVYQSWGQYQKALEYQVKSLAIRRKIGDVSGEGVTLTHIGMVYKSWGQYQKALEYYEKDLALRKKIGVPYNGTENSIGDVYLAMGDIQRAEPILKKTNFSVSLGRLALLNADYNEARSQFERKLNRSLKNRDADGLFTGHTGLGLSYEGLNQYDKSAEHFKHAINLTEQIRDSLTPAQRADFYDAQILNIPRIIPYEGLARVLLKSGKPEQSFKESEGTKARIFAESLSGRSQNVVLDVPKNVLDQDADINFRLAGLSQGLKKAYEKGSTDAIESFEKQVSDVRSEKERHIDKLRNEYPLFAATKYPQPMSLEHSAIKDDEWTLEYEVTEPGICVYLGHGKKIIKGLFKTITRNDLDELVRKFREPVEMLPGDSPIPKLKAFDFAAGKKLSDLLLGDILSDLPKDTPVIIIPDGSLGVVPFEMLTLNNAGKILTDGKRPQTSGAEFFGDRNPISYYQSVTALTLARTLGKLKKTGEKTLAMVDPVFNAGDPRLVNYAKQEQERLVATLPTDLLVPMEDQNSITFRRVELTAQLGASLKNANPSRTDLYEGMAAKKSLLLEKDLTVYRAVVFATHGYFGKGLPGIQEPVLILTLLDPPKGQDGFLRMSEVMGLNINCDIAALTACQSGLGRNISGEGNMGMGRAFQYAGAKSVLMSLWSVAEKSSVMMVESFFGHLKEGKSKQEALKLARDQIRQAGYDHPFFWAPFILVGEAS
ncbi:MAG: CHAT domain-containing tetratricopeptide repeat protein [Desulfomonilaceae bacterium]